MMRIQGLQKLTLLDYPDQVACTLFTAGCGLRCPFCHNAALVVRPLDPLLEESEIFAFLKKRQGILDGVCITGGEPTMQPDLPAFIRRVRAMGYLIKLDTNGTAPRMLAALLQEGLLDYVAMDIKAAKENYPRAVGVDQFDCAPVSESAGLIMRGRADYEFRTTVVKGIHTAADFTGIARWLRGAKRYFLQQFVDSGDLVGTGCAAFSERELNGFAALLAPSIPSVEVRGI